MPEPATSDLAQQRIARLPCWSGELCLRVLEGGITNRNFLAEDAKGKYVVRLSEDIVEHGILRFNELAASRAAHLAGLSPAVVHAELGVGEPGIVVLEFVEAKALEPVDVTDPKRLGALVDLVRRTHHRLPKFLRGPILSFNVFHVLRNYVAWLLEHRSPYSGDLVGLQSKAEQLEQKLGQIDLVFGHNDLLAANILDDGTRLWLIDWEYAGFNTPLFDLGGLASNNGFAPDQELQLLEEYFQHSVSARQLEQYNIVKCASLLRETLWSMVSELRSNLEFDYAAYTLLNRQRFEHAWEGL